MQIISCRLAFRREAGGAGWFHVDGSDLTATVQRRISYFFILSTATSKEVE